MTTSQLPIYRRSQLEAISDGCLHRVKAIWIDGQDDSSDIALTGIAGHAITYRYIQRLLAKGLTADVEEANEAFVEGVAQTKTPSRLIPDLRSVWFMLAEKFELPIDRFLGAEELVTRHEKQAKFRGDLILAHPDRNELEVIDFKFGWHPPATEYEVKLLFQARVYSWLAMAEWPNFLSYRFTIHAVRFNRFTSVTFTPSDLDPVELEVRAAIEVVEEAKRTQSWPAVPGPSCRFCTLDCPVIQQNIVVPKRILQATQAQRIGSWLLAADGMIKLAKTTLKAYVAAHGPVNVMGIEWANRASTRRSYPAKAVVQALSRIEKVGGLDGELSFSQSALNPFFTQFGKQLEDELAPLASEKPSWRFSAKRPGEADEAGDE